MSKTVVGMITSYKGLNQGDWLWKQTPEPFGVWKNIQMLKNAPQPDFLLMYQYDFLPPQQKSDALWGNASWRRQLHPKILPQSLCQVLQGKSHNNLRKDTEPESSDPLITELRGVAPGHSLYLLREPPLPEIVQKNQSNYAVAQQYCQYVSGPDDFAPTPNYMPAIWYVANSFSELDRGAIPEKVKSCSWITSGINRTENHRKRLAFLHQLQQTTGVELEVFGRGLPTHVRSIGELQNKWCGMAPYYYNLAIENYADNDWYVSEKLWDALLSWCLPIYYGGSAADRLLPPGSFLRLPSLDETGIAYIQEMTATPDAWYAAKAAIAEARQIILHKLNLLNWLAEYVEQF